VTRPFRLGLDLDGVLCNFTSAFLDALAHVSGRQVPPDYVQTTWSTWADYRESEVKLAWEYTETPYWWERLAPLNHPTMPVKHFLIPLWRFPDRLDVSFITTRPAEDARRQSINWLLRHGMASPQVLVAPSAMGKAALCHLLKLDLFVDDYWNNLQAIAVKNQDSRERYPGSGHACETVLFCQPYNEPHRGQYTCVDGLPDLLSLIGDRAQLPSFTKPARTAPQVAQASAP
jgi:hypothetical protein